MADINRRKLKDFLSFHQTFCTACGSQLGRIISSGRLCSNCGLRVCNKCRAEQIGSSWICLLCTGNHVPINSLKIKKDSRSIRRSSTISNPQRTNSPVLKSYTVLYPEESCRQFYSLPRMTSSEKKNAQNIEKVVPGKGYHSTLHPFTTQNKIFIEETFWDYYESLPTRTGNESNRSSCERSLGGSVDYDYSLKLTYSNSELNEGIDVGPLKPERKPRSKSLNSYDVKFSPLRTYCVLKKENKENERQEEKLKELLRKSNQILNPPKAPKSKLDNLGFNSLRKESFGTYSSIINSSNNNHKSPHSAPSTLKKESKSIKSLAPLQKSNSSCGEGGNNKMLRNNNHTNKPKVLTDSFNGFNSYENSCRNEQEPKVEIHDSIGKSVMNMSDKKGEVKGSTTIVEIKGLENPYDQEILTPRAKKRLTKDYIDFEAGSSFSLPVRKKSGGFLQNRGWDGSLPWKRSKFSLPLEPFHINGRSEWGGEEERVIAIEVERRDEENHGEIKASKLNEKVSLPPAMEEETPPSLYLATDGLSPSSSSSSASSSFLSHLEESYDLHHEIEQCEEVDSDFIYKAFESEPEAEGEIHGGLPSNPLFPTTEAQCIDPISAPPVSPSNVDNRVVEEAYGPYPPARLLSDHLLNSEWEESGQMNKFKSRILVNCDPEEKNVTTLEISGQFPSSEFEGEGRKLVTVSNTESDHNLVVEENTVLCKEPIDSLAPHNQCELVGVGEIGEVGSKEWNQSINPESVKVEIVSENPPLHLIVNNEGSLSEVIESGSGVAEGNNEENKNGNEERIPQITFETRGVEESHGMRQERINKYKDMFDFALNNGPLRRSSPEGQEKEGGDSEEKTEQTLPPPRSSPDGADKSMSSSSTPVESFDVTSDDDSWVDEILFEEDEKPPLDLTLHTIVEESESENGPSSLEFDSKEEKCNDLEKYFNFFPASSTTYANEDSEFSDTFSESSYSTSEVEERLYPEIDPAELASSRLEKYFFNLGVQIPPESDSVGSESETDNTLKKKKKIKKHHRRSADFSDEEKITDDEEPFGIEGVDTIKKIRRKNRSSENLLQDSINSNINVANNLNIPNEAGGSRDSETDQNVKTWSSDEEVNLMMSKLGQIIKSVVRPDNACSSYKDTQQLVYLENELIRLMKSEDLKTILSSEESEEDVYKFIQGVARNSAENSPAHSPALLAKVMNHIGNRLSIWMSEDTVAHGRSPDEKDTLKCAPSVSSDLNEDRFSWKGSFESALAAKRQSVGSTDSISSSDFQLDKSILRSSSLHHLANNQPIKENIEEERITNSLPRLNQPTSQISRAHSLVIDGPVKSARYRPPGFQKKECQSTPALNEDPELKIRSESLSAIYQDKPQIRGQVEFGLQYNYKLTCLEVRVKQCRDLASVDIKRNRSDPYVKAYLLPDKTKSGKRKTKVKKNTLNPIFDETLKFSLTLTELQNRTLWLSVWHSDIFGKNEFLGEVLIGLRDRVFDDPNEQWFELMEMSVQPDDLPKGDLIIALKWQQKMGKNGGHLTILVKEAKNLIPKNGVPSTFVKCMLLKDKRKQKTTICRRNFNPTWNQTLSFEEADDEGLELSIWNYKDLLNHDLLGMFKLDSDSELWENAKKRSGFWVEGSVQLS